MWTLRDAFRSFLSPLSGEAPAPRAPSFDPEEQAHLWTAGHLWGNVRTGHSVDHVVSCWKDMGWIAPNARLGKPSC